MLLFDGDNYLDRVSKGHLYPDIDYGETSNGPLYVTSNQFKPIPSVFIPPFYKRAHPPPSPPHWHHKPDHDKDDGFEKSLMHLVFPIIIVFGLGSLVVPMIALFFAAFLYNNGSLNGGGCFKLAQRTGRNDVMNNLLDLLITVEKALFSFDTSKSRRARLP